MLKFKTKVGGEGYVSNNHSLKQVVDKLTKVNNNVIKASKLIPAKETF